MEKIVIAGSGCAGLTAAIYAARAGLNPLVIEGAQSGGILTTTSNVENFPGFADGIDGFTLLWNMRKQAEKFGARFLSDQIVNADLKSALKKIALQSSQSIECEKIILALGAKPKLTGAKNEEMFYGGKGVSTCATCDGAFYKGKTVAVVGGGDSAAEEALFLTKFAQKVFLIHRRDSLRASDLMAKRVLSNPKITPIWNHTVSEVLGENGKVCALVLKDTKNATLQTLQTSAMFVAIGSTPNTDFCKGQLDMDSNGYIIPQSGSLVKTNLENVFAAGDCCDPEFRQAITAAATGAMAAILCSKES